MSENSIYVMDFCGVCVAAVSDRQRAEEIQRLSIPDELMSFYRGIGSAGQMLFENVPQDLEDKYPQVQFHAEQPTPIQDHPTFTG